MMRIRVGLAVLCCLLVAATGATLASAASGGTVPLPGSWEGNGPHGVPLSFKLVRRGGHLVLTSLAAGSPATCPALPRDAEAVPLASVSYAGPGGVTGVGSSLLPPVALSGRVPARTQRIFVRGSFSSPGSGTLSVPIQKNLGCGWPDSTITWSVHRARRRDVADGTWTGPLTAQGLINGNVRLVVAEEGRVIQSFTTFFTCLTDTQQGNTTVRAVPAFEFIRPDGSFYSPLTGTLVRGHNTTWSGRFSAAGTLTGTLKIFNDCTNRVIKARFSAMRTKR
jgi:hypothetical protein